MLTVAMEVNSLQNYFRAPSFPKQDFKKISYVTGFFVLNSNEDYVAKKIIGFPV